MALKDLDSYRFDLPFKAVHIQCLDENKQVINRANGSGFIGYEKNKYFLFTCWHLVTGINIDDYQFKRTETRKYLSVSLQIAHINSGMTSIGGNKTIFFSLYDKNDNPLWQQVSTKDPPVNLNFLNNFLPDFDCVKIPLPDNLIISDHQFIDLKKYRFPHGLPSSGDKVHLVGFPYGYSALGMEQPTPITLTRYIASWRFKERRWQYLLDGTGAPGLSGCPVFIERDNRLYLLGIYTGIIYPDYILGGNERYTALGTVTNLNLFLAMLD